MKKGFYKAENDKESHTGKIKTPEGSLNRVKIAIEEAKKEKEEIRKFRRKIATSMIFALLLCGITAIPNLSPEAALAMSRMPVLGDFFEAITFRDYYYESDNFNAEVHIPEIVSEGKAKKDGGSKTINKKVAMIAEQLVDAFEENLKDNTGYSELYVNYEVLSTTEKYFALKLITYQGAGSGYEKNYYYTIDLNTGKELGLSDIFPKGSDYITPISENIKDQMRENMIEDDGLIYWIDLEEEDPIKVWEFEEISEDQQFYIDENNNLVISFGEGDVAPMYMGCMEFTIPGEVTENII